MFRGPSTRFSVSNDKGWKRSFPIVNFFNLFGRKPMPRTVLDIVLIPIGFQRRVGAHHEFKNNVIF